ncbi:thioredoxin family protein [Paludibaculum fermentans]|uniref:thioredoxin family protein n=1 Tax=Paludibaculum fermentans TaxID=1473598 RepID=UPI003EBBB0AE
MQRRLVLIFLAACLFGAEGPYDPKANPATDLKRAMERARQENKHVLLDVGGEWCSWCHRLDRFFAANAELLAFRESRFVFLKVNFSPENENKEFLAQYPKIEGYPHLIVLDCNGKLLRSQETDVLEEGKGYNLQRFNDFLKSWAPKR